MKTLQLASLRSQLERDRQLAADGLLSQELLKKSELAVAQATIELKQLEGERENARIANRTELDGLALEMSKLRKESREARRVLELATPRADREGVLTWALTEEGVAIRKGDVIARVADLSSFRVDATVSDVHAGRLAPGLPVVVRLNDVTLEGRVARVVRLPQPARQPVNVVDVLRRIEGLVHADREKRAIAWAWDVEEDDAVAAMDAVQMEQALLNIVKNAIEAIDETAGDPRTAAHDADTVDGDAQSTPAPRTGTVTVRLTRANGRLRLTIEDTGPGIPPDGREQLFTPCFTTKPHGQGIGLTMVQEILSNHGFEFSLDSAPAGPTRFTIDM